MIFAYKNQKAYCQKCGDHLFTFARDIIEHTPNDPSDVYRDRGQAPFYLGEEARCRKCNAPYRFERSILNEPIGIVVEDFKAGDIIEVDVGMLQIGILQPILKRNGT